MRGMDGFERVELEQAGLVGRLFGRKPKGNALREIQNVGGEGGVKDLTAADVENILSDYELPRERATEGLRDFYRRALDYRIKDFHLSDDEIADLRQLRYVVLRHNQNRPGLIQVVARHQNWPRVGVDSCARPRRGVELPRASRTGS